MDGLRWLGLALTWLGYLAALVLVLQPFHPGVQASALVMALLAPSCMGVGLLLCAVGENRGLVLRVAGAALMLLGLAALLGLFAEGLGLVEAGDTLVLWLVAPVALCAGIGLNYAGNALASLQAGEGGRTLRRP